MSATEYPLDERRQRAREAFYDHPSESPIESLEAAVETATRVQITDEARKAYIDAWASGACSVKEGLTAALRELGFEVEP